MARSSLYGLLPDIGADEMRVQKCAPAESELSRGLVTGAATERRATRARGVWVWVALVTLAAACTALLAAALVRETRLAAHGGELAALRRDVDALEAQVAALVARAAAERNLIDDLTAYENGLYVDGAGEAGEAGEAGAAQAASEARAAAELDSITVLEDDNDDDDEEYDEIGEDGESGNYQDYSSRQQRTQTAKSDMSSLTPEDFLGKVLSARPPDVPDRASKIRELRRILHQSPTSPQPARTASEATAAAAITEQRLKRSLDAESPLEIVSDSGFYSAKISDSWRKRTPPETERAAPEVPPPPPPSAPRLERPRRTRNSDDEDEEAGVAAGAGVGRPFVAAHFHGNTSHLSTRTHEHYKGNGLLRLPHEAAHSVWSPAAWTRRAPRPAPTLTRAGHVRVHRSGVYFVYVQIYYLDAHDMIGWVLHRTRAPEHDEREAVLQCARSSPTLERRDKPNSCYSAAALELRAGDRLAVRNTGGDRHSLMLPEKSFVGLIQLADADADTDADAE